MFDRFDQFYNRFSRMTLQPSFTLKLNHKLLPKTIAVGNFDGSRCSLAAAAANGKVMESRGFLKGHSQGELILMRTLGVTGAFSDCAPLKSSNGT